jgi:CRP-like cAMP-binding protein
VRRFRQDMKLDALKRSPLFADLSRRQLVQIARLTDDLEVPAGTVLCKEGSRGREFFVILDGEVSVARAQKQIATLGNGEFFGEIALLEPVKRTATVTAATPLSFFVITDAAFRSVLAIDATIERKVLVALARRLVALTGGDPTLDS